MIINGKNFYYQATDSDIKRYEEIRKLTTGQDYTTGCLLDYDYIKNHYKLTAVDLSRQKELDADPEGIQRIEFVGQLKNVYVINADRSESMFVLTISKTVKTVQRNEIKILLKEM